MSLDGKLRISEAYPFLLEVLEVPQIGVPMIKGQPGIGKSQMMIDLCYDLYEIYPKPAKCGGCDKASGDPTDHEHGCPGWHAHGSKYCSICKLHKQGRLHRTFGPHLCLRDIRLAYFDPIEVKGLSGGIERLGELLTVVFTPEWIPTDFEEYSVLFFDEFNLASKPTQDGALQIIHDRRVHNTELSPKCAIAAAGNRVEDGANIVRMSGPLNNRLLHIELMVSSDDWVAYAKSKGIRGEIIGAVEYIPHVMLPEFDRDRDAQPTPRTLEKLSQLVDRAGKGKAIIEDAVWRRQGVPTIGTAAVTELIAFIGLFESVSPEEIVLEGKMPTFEASQLDRMFAAQCAVAYYINRKVDAAAAEGAKKEDKQLAAKILSKTGVRNIFNFLDLLPIDLRVKCQGDFNLPQRINICTAFYDHEPARFQEISERMAGAIG